MIAIFHNVPQLRKRLDWAFYTAPQEHALGRRIPQTRGRVLGGSSSVNRMLFVRGNAKNYDDWAAEGNQGWGFDDVLPSFERMEPARRRHGGRRRRPPSPSPPPTPPRAPRPAGSSSPGWVPGTATTACSSTPTCRTSR